MLWYVSISPVIYLFTIHLSIIYSLGLIHHNEYFMSQNINHERRGENKKRSISLLLFNANSGNTAQKRSAAL